MPFDAEQFYSSWDDLYDVMIDWEKRLSVEIPQLIRLLHSEDAHKVLDVACGTGRHVLALAQGGFEAIGTDLNSRLLEQAEKKSLALDQACRPSFYKWDFTSKVPDELEAIAPFDMLLCLGNSFPHVIEEEKIRLALENFSRLLIPEGRMLIQVKNLERRRNQSDLSLPRIDRTLPDGSIVSFHRYYEFDTDWDDIAIFHLEVGGERMLHEQAYLKIYSPEDFERLLSFTEFTKCLFYSNLDCDSPYDPLFSEDLVVLIQK